MKTLLTILLLFVLQNSFAQTTHYVSTGGNDANSGTIGSPWATLHYACSQVTTAGDTIYINPGTYIETNKSVLAEGVSIKGAGTSSHIICHYVSNVNSGNPDEAAITLLSSTEGTNGNQSISNILIDGDNLTANLGILIKRRGGVAIHDVTIKDFYVNGLMYLGSSSPYTQPTTYPTNNTIYNCHIDNCTDSTDVSYIGLGVIYMSGQKDMTIHDNSISDTARTPGRNGDLMLDNRFGLGLKIYNNNFYKPSKPHDNWNFHLEIPWGLGGTEIYNNNFIGGDAAIDAGNFYGYYDEANYSFSFSIHDNYYFDPHPTNNGDHGKCAISIEGQLAKDIYIYNETFNNIVQPFGITDGTTSGTASHDTNIVIHNIVCMNMGVDTVNYYQNLIEITKNETGGSIYGLYIANITMIPNSLVNAAAIKIANHNSSTMKNIVIANNIIERCVNGTWLNVDNTGGTMDSLIVRNNITYNNANSNNPTFTGNTVTNYINSGNLHSDPLLVSSTDYHLQSGSPAIGAAYPYGYGSDIGALQYTTIAAPTISVSGNQTITVSNTSVSAVGTPASGQTITGYTWTKISGGTVIFGTATSASTTVTGLTTGTYVLRCTVTQSDGQTAYGDVTITVNIPPVPVTTSKLNLKLPTKFNNK